MVNLTLIAFYAVVMLQYDVAADRHRRRASPSLNVVALRFVPAAARTPAGRFEQDTGKLLATSFSGVQMIETLKAGGTESDFFARWAGYQAKAVRAEQDLGARPAICSSCRRCSPA